MTTTKLTAEQKQHNKNYEEAPKGIKLLVNELDIKFTDKYKSVICAYTNYIMKLTTDELLDEFTKFRAKLD